MVTWSGVEEIARSSSVSNAPNSFKLEKKMSEIHVDADRGLRLKGVSGQLRLTYSRINLNLSNPRRVSH